MCVWGGPHGWTDRWTQLGTHLLRVGREGLGSSIQPWFAQRAPYFCAPVGNQIWSEKSPAYLALYQAHIFCMNEEEKNSKVKTKGFFIQKMPSIKKKIIRSLLFPCTVSLREKPAGYTLLKAQPQRGSGRHTTPELPFCLRYTVSRA